MIAASIVFVALQNLFWPQQSRGGARLGVAFFFGLFHGLGFAGGLLDAMEGMAGLTIGLAIFAFSFGIELAIKSWSSRFSPSSKSFARGAAKHPVWPG